MPGRAVRNQTVPAGRPPGLGDAVLFQNDVVDTGAFEMSADRHPGLSAADNYGVHLFNGHPALHLRSSASCYGQSSGCHKTPKSSFL